MVMSTTPRNEQPSCHPTKSSPAYSTTGDTGPSGKRDRGRFMRIAYLNNFFLPRPSGSSHLTAELAKRFAHRGDEVVVITTEYEGAPADEQRDGYRVRRLPCVTLPKLDIAFNFDATLTASPSNLRRVFRTLDALRPDVVHAHGQF